VIVPVRNEERHIAACLESILAQDYPAERVEVLVVDGRSIDDTRSIVAGFARRDRRVRLFDNPGQWVAAGLNIGIRAAAGEVIARVDGHTVLEPDYVSSCVRYLEETGADNVGGMMRPASASYLGRAIGLATSSPFAAGDARFRYSQRAGFVDTVYLGAFRRAVFDRVGGFDERLARNQDYELNFRLRQAGGRIFYTPAIRSWYYGRESLRGLWRQYFDYGRWKAVVIRRAPRSARPRQLVAPALVASVVGLAVAALTPTPSHPRTGGKRLPALLLAAVGGSYLAASLLASIVVAARRGWRYLPALPAAYAVVHVAWGLGFWRGLMAGTGKADNSLTGVRKSSRIYTHVDN
jgi:GT2 family glycosyltransferase